MCIQLILIINKDKNKASLKTYSVYDIRIEKRKSYILI